jgi:hypothetical protein
MSIVAVIMSIGLILTALFPVLRVDDEPLMNGFTAIFGGEITTFLGFSILITRMSVMNFIIFFFPLILSIFMALTHMLATPQKTLNRVLYLFIGLAFLFSLVMVVRIADFTPLFAFDTEHIVPYEATLGLGSVLAIISAAIGMLTSFVYVIIPEK